MNLRFKIFSPGHSATHVDPGKTTRTYVFVFIPVLMDREVRGPRVPFDPGTQAEDSENGARALARKIPFWTWFIDNPTPRPADQPYQGEKNGN